MKVMLTAEQLQSIAGEVPANKRAAQRDHIEGIAAALPDVCREFDITTPLRLAHFVGQMAQESDAFCAMEEYASGAAYEGRRDLGNTVPGDGKRFKGRGPFMLTGRANYTAASAQLGVDLVSHPEDAADPALGLRIAGWYWAGRDINALADRNDIEAVTRAINGGHNGLSERRRYFARAAAVLGIEGAADVLLKLGSQGEDVRALQQRLDEINYFVGRIDGIFGAMTDSAVRAFQLARGLTVDGKVRLGGETWTALADAIAEDATREVSAERATTTVKELADNGSRIAGSSVAGVKALAAAVAGSLGLAALDGAASWSDYLSAGTQLLDQLGGASDIERIMLLAAAVYSGVQHLRAARARAEDHRTGRTA